MASNKMMKFLDKFLHKQAYGDSCLTSNLNESRFVVNRVLNASSAARENPIKIQ